MHQNDETTLSVRGGAAIKQPCAVCTGAGYERSTEPLKRLPVLGGRHTCDDERNPTGTALAGDKLGAADDTHPAGSTGGAWEVVQKVEQMPEHAHPQAQQAGNGGIGVCVTDPDATPGANAGLPFRTTVWSNGSSEVIQTYPTGGNKPMPIVNKYTACYIWKRTG